MAGCAWSGSRTGIGGFPLAQHATNYYGDARIGVRPGMEAVFFF